MKKVLAKIRRRFEPFLSTKNLLETIAVIANVC